MRERRVLFACDLDSQVFGALPLARAFVRRGWRPAFAIHALGELSAAARGALAGFETLEAALGPLAVAQTTRGFDAVGVFATGSRIARFRHDAALAARAFGGGRPALFCGFNGLVYEKFEEGVAWRLGYDLVALNGPRDADAFRDFVAGGRFSGQPTAVVGLRRSAGGPLPPLKPAPAPGARKRFIFAEQVAAPSDPDHRRAMVATLGRLAAASPDWTLTIKARVRPGERTFHDVAAPIETLVAGLRAPPSNLALSHAPLRELLATADLLGTVSSTAFFDALDRGVPACVMEDFGVRNEYGTHVFFGSGVGRTFAECASLDDLPRRPPDPDWLARLGYGPTHGPDDLIDRLEAFDPTSPFQPQAQAPERAAAGDGPHGDVGPEAIAARRAEVAAALKDGDPAEACAALARLEGTLEASDRRQLADAAWRRREGCLAALARRGKFYWLYKRARVAVWGAGPPS